MAENEKETCVCGFNPPTDPNADCERCQLIVRLSAAERENERLARKVCLALVVFPEPVQCVVDCALDYDPSVDEEPEIDVGEVVSWDKLCHEAYEAAEQILAALTPQSEGGGA
jgi:hypothetical protein